MKKICINNKNRPSDIPTSHWVIEGNEYTIIDIAWLEAWNIWGVIIEEIDLRSFYPWKYFAADRFALTQEDIKRLINKDKIEESEEKSTTKIGIEELEEEYA